MSGTRTEEKKVESGTYRCPADIHPSGVQLNLLRSFRISGNVHIDIDGGGFAALLVYALKWLFLYLFSTVTCFE